MIVAKWGLSMVEGEKRERRGKGRRRGGERGRGKFEKHCLG